MNPSIRRGNLSLWAAMCCLALARTGAAQDPAQEASGAEALFREGLEAMRAGNYAEACPKISESYNLDPLPGVLFTLAECESAGGRSATAIEHYQNFLNSLTSLSSDRRDKFEERRRLALDKITALTALAPEITVDVSASAPQDLVVKRNDVVIEPSAYGVGKKVDKGDYVVSAELKGKLVWERRFTLSERDRARIAVPWPPGKTEPVVKRAAPSKQTSAGSDTSGARGTASTRTWMYVAGGIGVAGLATGVVAGAVALGKKATIADNCPDRQCNAEGRAAVDAGQSAALVSSIGFVVGLAGAGAATALFVFSRPDVPKDATFRSVRPTLAASHQSAAIGVKGSF